VFHWGSAKFTHLELEESSGDHPQAALISHGMSETGCAELDIVYHEGFEAKTSLLMGSECSTDREARGKFGTHFAYPSKGAV
jgi:hypothetical protein